MLRALLLLCLWICPVQAFAHPHIWVDTLLELLVTDKQITGLRVHLSFDEMYSTSFLMDADTNKNKHLDSNETKETIQAVFIDGQKDLYPFMYVAPHTQQTPFTLKKPSIWMKDKSLNYQFDIVFDKPQPLQGHHKFAIYDPEFYVGFEQELDIKMPSGVSCEQALEENKSISIYMGLVNPETYTLICER